ncbi:MAG: phosphotransferase [Rhodobacteraceae bacterium]|nr:phosphotransferase [Paracoccaceae bacterium]
MKALVTAQAARDLASYVLEHDLAQTCDNVQEPAKGFPLQTQFSDHGPAMTLLAWPFVDGEAVRPNDKPQIKLLGSALANLHRSMRQLQAQGKTTNFHDRAQDYRRWLVRIHSDLMAEFSNGRLQRLTDRFDWLPGYLSENADMSFEAFFSAPSQLIHADLNPGNIFCTGGTDNNEIVFLDFEAATQSLFPLHFDLAILIERQFVASDMEVSEWMELAAALIDSYTTSAGKMVLTSETCLNEAISFSILRAIAILDALERAGRGSPDAEWKKFERLSVLHRNSRNLLDQLARSSIEKFAR